MRATTLCLAIALGLLLGAQLGCQRGSGRAVVCRQALSGSLRIPRIPPQLHAAPSADAQLDRSRRTSVQGHLLTIPPSFQSQDGGYDLAIHFHGNPNAVEESFERAGINGVLLVVNLGPGASRYVDRFGDPSQLEGILRRVDEKLAERGLVGPKRRRLALSAWSAGYGAIMRVLDNATTARLVDAVLLLDGLHARRMPITHGVDQQDLEPFAAFAERAAAGRALMVISHSEIEPEGPIVSAADCSSIMLERLGVEREPATGRLVPTTLAAARAFYAPSSLWPLDLSSVARRRGLVVRAYEGRAPEHHIAHLFQMEKLVLDDLRRWWTDGTLDEPGA